MDKRLNYALGILASTIALMMILGHFALNPDKPAGTKAKEAWSKQDDDIRAQLGKLRSADLGFIEKLQKHNMELLKKQGAEVWWLFGIKRFERELIDFHGTADKNALREFVAGSYFFTQGVFSQAKQNFFSTARIADTASLQIILGITFESIGEVEKAHAAFLRAREMADTLKDRKLIKLAERMIQQSTVSKGRSTTVFIFGGIAISMIAVLLGVFLGVKSARSREKKQGVWSHIERRSFLDRIEKSGADRLDGFEERIKKMMSDDKLHSYTGVMERRLADVRRECEKLGTRNSASGGQTRAVKDKFITAQKMYLIGMFYTAISNHRRSGEKFLGAIEIIGAPSFHLMAANSFMARGRKKAAIRFLEQTRAIAEEIGERQLEQMAREKLERLN